MRVDPPQLRHRLAHGRLEPLDDGVRLAERQLARELDVEAELGAALEPQHADVVDLAHAGHAERGGGRALAQVALAAARLDVHDDVGVGQLAADRLLDLVGGRVRLGEAGVGADGDDEVDEVARRRRGATRSAADLEVAELGERAADRLLGVGVARSISTSIDWRASRAAAMRTSAATISAAIASARGSPAATRTRPTRTASEPAEVGGEVQRVGRQRRRVVAAGGARR